MASIHHFGILCDMKSLAIFNIAHSRNFAIFCSRSLIKLLGTSFCICLYIIISIVIHMILTCDIKFRINCFFSGIRRPALVKRGVSIHAMIFRVSPRTVILGILYFSFYMKRRSIRNLLIIQSRRFQIRL